MMRPTQIFCCFTIWSRWFECISVIGCARCLGYAGPWHVRCVEDPPFVPRCSTRRGSVSQRIFHGRHHSCGELSFCIGNREVNHWLCFFLRCQRKSSFMFAVVVEANPCASHLLRSGQSLCLHFDSILWFVVVSGEVLICCEFEEYEERHIYIYIYI